MHSISSLTTTLQQLLTRIIQWIEYSDSWRTSQLKRLKRNIKKSVYEVNIPCSESDLEIVHHHASILCSGHCGEFISLWKHSYLHLNKAWRNRFQTPNFGEVNKLVVYFLQHLKEVFKVSKLIKDVDSYVLVASFMDFLSELLIGKAFADINLVIKELRCFITIFLDTPFQDSTEDRQVHTFLSQFETLVNEAGRLVHSFVFSLHPSHERIYEVFLEPIGHLKANVIEFLNSSTYMNTWNTRNCAMSSVFIVDSFLYDLENLMNREDDPIVEVKDHVERLHWSLKQSWSFSKNHSHKTDDEVKEIVSLAYDAEYLINYFLCGDAPAWYLTVRLPGIVHNVELVGTRLEGEILENHDIDQELILADNFGSTLSPLQTGINSGPVNDTIVGFDAEELKILDELVGGGEGLQIISIIGMGGLGKTTLAKKLYNHPTVRDEFDKFSWCIVSQMYKRKNFLIHILMGLESGVEKAIIEKMEDDFVGLRIYQFLKGRRYFIVIDDIWKLSAWEDIKRYFPIEMVVEYYLLVGIMKQFHATAIFMHFLSCQMINVGSY